MSENTEQSLFVYVKNKILHHKLSAILFTLFLLLIFGAWMLSLGAEQRYKELNSNILYDRNNVPLSIKENIKGHYAYETYSLPEEFKKLLIKKEDRFFYYHLGVNPISSLRAAHNYFSKGKAGGSSTLTQQLAKNLLGTESSRSIFNKLIESMYAVSMEIFLTKEELLLMYANTVYLGNQVQGFETASQAYFDKPFAETTHSEQISLLTTLSHPSSRNPWEKESIDFATSLNDRISADRIFTPPVTTDRYSFQKDSYFELRTAGITCEQTCITTIDNNVTEGVRSILNRHVSDGRSRNIRNGAVVIIDAKNSELLALVGSKNPNNESDGDQINMTIKPRPIGSTIKPFIYAAGFKAGLRPYSLVEDREYKYPVAAGFSIYPKNYDGQYRGEINLHEALSNSLNVPSVKVLEYIGLEDFYTFLSDSLEFKPIQDFDSYQYGIALGGLEMDLMTLTHYFTLFPQQGSLSPIKILKDSDENFSLPPQSHIQNHKTIIQPEYTELVHAIISDRLTGVNQFGLEGNLNINHSDYGVKTGTSRDFHDSWIVGYTPDFVVGVWIGNTENEPLKQVSGSSGAGAVWHDVMEYLLASKYNHDTEFTPRHLKSFSINNNEEWGIRGDIVSEHKNILLEDNLILSLHEGDNFELRDDTVIPLKARKPVLWSINGKEHEQAKDTSFNPTEVGAYEISAFDKDGNILERVLIEITQPE